MKNALKLGLVAAGLTMASALTPVQAQAATGNLWLGENQSMGGKNCGWASSQPDLSKTFCSFSDKASSVWNGSDNAWVLYDDSGYGDRRYCIKANGRINDLHDPRWNFGDTISSIKRLSGNSCTGYPTF